MARIHTNECDLIRVHSCHSWPLSFPSWPWRLGILAFNHPRSAFQSGTSYVPFDPPMPPDPVPPRSRFSVWPLLRSFRFAFAGLGFLLRTQRNARVHVAVGAIACALAAWLRVSRVEWAVLVF